MANIPKRYRDFDIQYCQERGLATPMYPDGDFFLQANGLQPGSGGQLGNQQGYQNGDPYWAGQPQGENVAGGNRRLVTPFGDRPFAQKSSLIPVPVPSEDLRDDQKWDRLPRLTMK